MLESMTPPYSRRDVLRAAGAAALAGTAGGLASGTASAAPTSPDALVGFLHGVASGDPFSESVVLWTRVTPTPESAPGSGVGPDVQVTWQVSTDERFRRVIARGAALAGAGRDHTVSVVANGLRPATTYWYRFQSAGYDSPVGRTRTAPAVGSAVAALTMGVVSCANWQAGAFAAYRHLADRDDLDLVLHLGDYLYEYAPGEYQARDVVVRPHDPPVETTVLRHYRRRHAQYKTDPDLQRLHARSPFVVTWDDHESANDAWAGGAENHDPATEGTWSDRRSAAARAYAEWMPVRFGDDGRLFRRLAFGSLASVSMLDLRSYRDEQASSPIDPGIDDPNRSITGAEQMRWLLEGLSSVDVQWKIVGNPVMITPVRFPSTLSTGELAAIHQLTGSGGIDGVPYNVDQWDGYTADRNRVVRHLRDHAVADTVFLTGDIHSAWACDIPADPLTYPATGDSVATELVCTSVTSDNLDDILRVPPRTASIAVEAAFRAANPHVKHLDFDSHGYSVVVVTPASLRMDWFALADRTDPASTARLSTSWGVDAGTRRVRRLA